MREWTITTTRWESQATAERVWWRRRKSFTEGKGRREGGGEVGFYPHPNVLFSLEMRGRLYVTLKMQSLRLLEGNSNPFSATTTAAGVRNNTSQSLPWKICEKATYRPQNKLEEFNFPLKQKALLAKKQDCYSKTFSPQGNGRVFRTFELFEAFLMLLPYAKVAIHILPSTYSHYPRNDKVKLEYWRRCFCKCAKKKKKRFFFRHA